MYVVESFWSQSMLRLRLLWLGKGRKEVLNHNTKREKKVKEKRQRVRCRAADLISQELHWFTPFTSSPTIASTQTSNQGIFFILNVFFHFPFLYLYKGELKVYGMISYLLLITFHKSILVSLWTFQLTLIFQTFCLCHATSAPEHLVPWATTFVP